MLLSSPTESELGGRETVISGSGYIVWVWPPWEQLINLVVPMVNSPCGRVEMS